MLFVEILTTLKTDARADHISLAMSLVKNETSGMERETPGGQTRLNKKINWTNKYLPLGSKLTMSNASPITVCNNFALPTKKSTPLSPGPPGLKKIGPLYFCDVDGYSEGIRIIAIDALFLELMGTE